jgi:hypothetical protein
MHLGEAVMQWRSRVRMAAAVLWVFFSAALCRACNPGFIPGDACFHSILTDDFLTQLRAGGKVMQLHYAYPEPLVGCGYTGFAHLEIRNCPPSLHVSLEKVYRAVRKTHPKLVRILDDRGSGDRGIEINGLDLFVYNKEVDWKSEKIGLKYNEHWYDFPVDPALLKNRGGWLSTNKDSDRMAIACYRYVSFLPGLEAVAEDWQYSSRFAGLAVRVPNVNDWGLGGPEIESPVTANAEDVQLVVTCEPLDDYFRRKADTTFYVIRTTGIRELQWRLSDDETRMELSDKPFNGD